MIEHPIASWWFALENIAITAGYIFVAYAVAPVFMRRAGVRFWWTKVGAIGFFTLCGVTHAQMAWDAMFGAGMHTDMAGRWTSHLVHAPQAVAVWMFVVGLYLELTDVDWSARDRDTNPQPAPSQEHS